VGRFLEHSRIFQFHNDGRPDYLIGSADLMPRNLDRRVEAATQVSAPELQAELAHILDLCLAEKRQAWELVDDRWARLSPAGEAPGLQEKLIQETLERRQV
jgi:polyphosphate kinase